jgi:hypothetical protein
MALDPFPLTASLPEVHTSLPAEHSVVTLLLCPRIVPAVSFFFGPLQFTAYWSSSLLLVLVLFTEDNF